MCLCIQLVPLETALDVLARLQFKNVLSKILFSKIFKIRDYHVVVVSVIVSVRY